MRKVKVHWNLHKGGFSVTDRKTGLVIPGLTDNITILNPVAKLQQGKFDACHTKGKRHVCAWFIGDMVEYQPIEAEFRDMVHYNPFRNKHFTTYQGALPFNQVLGAKASFTQNESGQPITTIEK